MEDQIEQFDITEEPLETSLPLDDVSEMQDHFKVYTEHDEDEHESPFAPNFEITNLFS